MTRLSEDLRELRARMQAQRESAARPQLRRIFRLRLALYFSLLGLPILPILAGLGVWPLAAWLGPMVVLFLVNIWVTCPVCSHLFSAEEDLVLSLWNPFRLTCRDCGASVVPKD